jgi:hypothetical protein
MENERLADAAYYNLIRANGGRGNFPEVREAFAKMDPVALRYLHQLTLSISSQVSQLENHPRMPFLGR